MENNTPTGLKQIIQSMCPDGAGVVEGTVTQVFPLQIILMNDAKMTLGVNSLIVPMHLTNYSVTVSIAKGNKGSVAAPVSTGGKLTDFNLSGSMIVANALKQGEIVYLFSFNNGKQYYVLDRKG